MTITWIGMVLLLVGLVLMARGGVLHMFVFMLATSPLGGAAAFILPALGGSSIPPTYVALGFLVARVLLGGRASIAQVGEALRDNTALVVFCLYGAVTAFILPRLFAGELYVTPMRATDLRNLFDTFALKFTSQNITAAVYLLGTLLGAVVASTIARRPAAGPFVLKAIVIVTWFNVALAVAALVLTAAKMGWVVDIFRNGSYAQLDQSYRGLIRITGVFPEASSYAGYTFIFLILLLEAWLRDLLPRWTGPAALAVGMTLVFSTSSSAYLSLGAYAVLLLARWLLFPQSLPAKKAVWLLGFGFLAVLLVLLIAVVLPGTLEQFVDMLQQMTLNKADSISGRQRRFWAEQGLSAFKISYGLGIGAGSFRSSSLITAIAGSMGMVGLSAFLLYLASVFKPFRASTYGRSVGDQAMGVCCGWAALVGLIPSMVSTPSPDPGLLFGVLSGLAITLRLAPIGAPAALSMPVQRLAVGADPTLPQDPPRPPRPPRPPLPAPFSRPGA